MKKEIIKELYAAPALEVVEVRVEKNFLQSGTGSGDSGVGGEGWDDIITDD